MKVQGGGREEKGAGRGWGKIAGADAGDGVLVPVRRGRRRVALGGKRLGRGQVDGLGQR